MNMIPLRGVPAPLVLAAALTAIEGLLFLGYAVMELFSLSGDRVALALTTSGFFVLYGVGLLVGARGLARCQPWARSPVVFAQLLHLMVAWSFRGGETTMVAVVVALVSVLVLVGIFVPPSVRAMADHE